MLGESESTLIAETTNQSAQQIAQGPADVALLSFFLSLSLKEAVYCLQGAAAIVGSAAHHHVLRRRGVPAVRMSGICEIFLSWYRGHCCASSSSMTCGMHA
jgi:hypothetical protein